MTVTLVAFEALAVGTVTPVAARELGGVTLYGWVFSAFMLTNLVAISVAGPQADRDGPARPFAIGVALFAIGLLVDAAAPTMPVLVGGRAVQGFGAGMIGTVAYVAIGRGYPETERARVFAILSTAWVVPGLVGPALAGWVAEHLTWRLVFGGLVPLVAVSAALSLASLRRLTPAGGEGAAPRRLGAAVRLAVGTVLAIGAPTEFGLLGVPLVPVGVAMAVPALRRLLPEGTLSAQPGLPAAVLVRALLNMGFFTADAFVPFTIVRITHRSPTVAGLAVTAATLSWTTGSWVQAHRSHRTEARVEVGAGLICIAIGVAGTSLLLVHGVPLAVGIVAWGIAGLGMGLAYQTLSLVVVNAAPAGQEGVASAALPLADTIGFALGTGLAGVAVATAAATRSPLRTGVAVVFAIALTSTIAALLATPRISSRYEDAASGSTGGSARSAVND